MVIDVRELRIGSLVRYNGLELTVGSILRPEPRKEERFDGKWVIELFDGATTIVTVLEELQGIPIGERWLKNFGYRKVNVLHNGTEVYQGRHSAMVYLSDNEVTFPFRTTKIKHVHVFQNVFQCINGQEVAFYEKS